MMGESRDKGIIQRVIDHIYERFGAREDLVENCEIKVSFLEIYKEQGFEWVEIDVKKGKIKDFNNPDPSYQWLNLKNDKAIGKVNEDHEAGMIQMKFSINAKHENGEIDYKQFKAWKKPPPRRLGSKKIRCFIF